MYDYQTRPSNIHKKLLAIKIEEPECKVDQDCPSKLACINRECQNPCFLNNPCQGNQQCVVKDTVPIRTVACICPEGMVFTDRGHCQTGKIYLITQYIL